MTKEIKLTQGKVALVDDEDFKRLNQFKWRYDDGYAVRTSGPKSSQIKIYMHREVMQALNGTEVDHRETGSKLDNRRGNLRVGTHSQNMANRKSQINNTSNFKGVTWSKDAKKWRAQIRVKGHQIHLGYFKDPIEAAHAYDNAAREYFGEFARVNFPI